VLTSGGRLTPLSALQSGERVLSMSAAGLATYQEVFMWGHRDAGALASFVTIRAGGATLRATPGEGCAQLLRCWCSVAASVNRLQLVAAPG
jgi:hypothetical protein